MKRSKSSDPWAVLTIVLSVGLFVLALFVKGFTHEMLLETGVFLVSVKLILMAKKNTETEYRLEEGLANIQEMLAAKGEGCFVFKGRCGRWWVWVQCLGVAEML